MLNELCYANVWNTEYLFFAIKHQYMYSMSVHMVLSVTIFS